MSQADEVEVAELNNAELNDLAGASRMAVEMRRLLLALSPEPLRNVSGL